MKYFNISRLIVVGIGIDSYFMEFTYQSDYYQRDIIITLLFLSFYISKVRKNIKIKEKKRCISFSILSV